MCVTIYSIIGEITGIKTDFFTKLKIQAMDSDQQFFEDYNDDLLGSAWTNSDGSFKITFDNSTFSDNWLEKSPEIYLILRSSETGQIIYKTEVIKIDANGKNKTIEVIEIPITIPLDLIENKIRLLGTSTDIYSNNSQRILSAFSSLGDVTTLNNSNAARNFQLLTSSINAWVNYTNESTWKRIGYDGPQVPRYPLKSPDHNHRLTWEPTQ